MNYTYIHIYVGIIFIYFIYYIKMYIMYKYINNKYKYVFII